MKKLLIVVAAIVAAVVLVLWVISWFRVPEAVVTSGMRPWPGGLGTLESVASRFPPVAANEASKTLTALAKALPQNPAVEDFVWREVSRGELAIGNHPALPDVTALRDLLLREPVVWERTQGFESEDQTWEMRELKRGMARALVASALAKARANDPAAWDDLHAVWNLARSLDGQPQMMSRASSMSMARMINAVAWKMPLPAPAWFAELQQRDYVQPLLESFHYLTATYWNGGARVFPTKWIADSIDRDRQLAEHLFQTTTCDVTPPNSDRNAELSPLWRRAFRYRAEREATANALRVREGKPIDPQSRCSDGNWTFDGTTLRFSREIALPTSDRPMPMVLRVRP